MATLRQLVEQARLEGRLEGRRDGQVDVMLFWLRQRFGEVTAEVERCVRSSSSEQLERYTDRLLAAASPEEVVRTDDDADLAAFSASAPK